ncbi:hypothetical protein GOBAR_AA13838 [Gossypium barbadense]|uniref:Uncharacterized protein n=1 Tax=Gossypium barbadense TaxID=3634 RepID=A0A2P5XTX4_GOSBA|nr:hypothetical protein GOBAR_AA13838 [Gossypium barbadense]
MVCEKCQKKLSKVIVPDKWKEGASNTNESGGRKINENKLLSKKRRWTPYGNTKCIICKQQVHQDGKYCHTCAYSKGVCAMCGKQVLDTKLYKQSNGIMAMDLSLQFLFSSLVTASLVTLTVAQQQRLYLDHSCSESGGNFTRNSTYETNLNHLLSSFFRNTTHENGFYNFSLGQGSEMANAIALCRGDASSSDCFNCINSANAELRDRCPNQREAIIWYDYCMFRYTNHSILGNMEINPIFYMWNENNVRNVAAFSQALGSLLNNLTNTASSGTSLGKFATGNTRVGPSQTIYALLQCTADVKQIDCSSCLSQAIGLIPKCCNGKQGGRWYNANTSILTLIFPAIKQYNNNSCVFIISRLRKPKLKPQKHEATEAVDELITEESLQYDLNTIRAATDHFSDANKLGQGGFGAVYKGTLAGGKLIAVKRLSADSRQGDFEFENEVQLMANLQHRNLVRLQGFCLEGKERLLIYEFVPNGSLDKFLFDPVKKAYLDWERRYKIIGGVARGLLYLHQDSRLRIIHRDLKAGNILLDAEMTPKIADFGTARLCAVDQTQGATSRIVGTYGYMAPEYAMHGQFSVKSDVFSFGVLILEILSGQKNKVFQNGGDTEHLLNFAWRNWEAGTAFDLVDSSLRDGSRSELMRCIHIGLLCVQEKVARRPNMGAVVLMLTSYSVTLPLPSEPAFFMHSKAQSEVQRSQDLNSGTTISSRSGNEVAVASENELSITELYPR